MMRRWAKPPTFGFLVYRNSWAQHEERLPVYQGGSTGRPDGSLIIYTPGPELKVYCGGSDRTCDIYEYEFRNGSVAKVEFVNRNWTRSLFSQGEADDPSYLDSWFLVHYGDPDEGYCGAWICAPRWPTGENPSQWAFAFRLPDLCADRGCGGIMAMAVLAWRQAQITLLGPHTTNLMNPQSTLR